MTSFTSNSVDETISFAQDFANRLVTGDVILLDGDLGSGKTHFVKGIVAGLGGNQDIVNSPTFSIVQSYDTNISVFHFDFYRIKKSHEALDLGIDDYLFGDGICAIEWPDKIKDLWPDHYYSVTIRNTGPDSRVIQIDKVE